MVSRKVKPLVAILIPTLIILGTIGLAWRTPYLDKWLPTELKTTLGKVPASEEETETGDQPVDQASPGAEQPGQGVIVLSVNGPVHATVTDPLGRTVGPEGISIPDAEYVSNPNDPFKLILISNPTDGKFEIDVQGNDSGTYTIGLLDTFNPVPTVVTDPMELWDTIESQIEPATTVKFSLTYTEANPLTASSLVAETPIIEVPVEAEDNTVNGRALAGSNVEIRNASTGTTLGNSTTGASGHFSVLLSTPLKVGQRIYPQANGIAGVPVTTQ